MSWGHFFISHPKLGSGVQWICDFYKSTAHHPKILSDMEIIKWVQYLEGMKGIGDSFS